MELATHGAMPDGGVTRLALSEADIDARRLIARWADSLQAKVLADDAGNCFIRYAGRDPELPPVMAGSHIDTVPGGGKFDGAYGVVAALEVIEAMRQAGVRPKRSVEAVIWTNEEGARFSPGQMGAAAFAGTRSVDEILCVKDRDGVRVHDVLPRMLAALPKAQMRSLGVPITAFFEAHIEQGPELEAHATQIGVVTGIQGRRSFIVTVLGEAAHGGTARQSERKDALLGAVRIIGALEASVLENESDARLTIGTFSLEPNAPLVVPGRVRFSVDLRHPENATMKRLGDLVPAICARHRGACAVEVVENANAPCAYFGEPMMQLIEAAVDRLQLSHRRIFSLAGHDSREIVKIAPTGMIFVPCKRGLSHSALEEAEPHDLAAGARVLAEVVIAACDA